jgi:hypothetical protein
MNNVKKTIIKILEIARYQKDKDKFADEFILLCFEKTFDELAVSIPMDKREKLKLDISKSKDLESVAKYMGEYIQSSVLKATLQAVSARLFQDYIVTVMPSLNDNRKDKLLEYIEELATDKNNSQFPTVG